jgi:hypothetical protein
MLRDINHLAIFRHYTKGTSPQPTGDFTMLNLLSLVSTLQGYLANPYIHYVFLAVMAVYTFVNTNWKKPAVWLVVHGAVLVLAAVLAYTHLDLFLGAGLGVSLTSMLSQYLTTKLSPLSNKLEYAKTFLQNLFFYPVHLVDNVYSWVQSKLNPPKA